MTDSKYLEFMEVHEDYVERKTKLIEVRSRLHGTWLGDIRWYGRWRQYTFFPAEKTVFNDGCLRDIADFIDGLMAERRGLP